MTLMHITSLVLRDINKGLFFATSLRKTNLNKMQKLNKRIKVYSFRDKSKKKISKMLKTVKSKHTRTHLNSRITNIFKTTYQIFEAL